MRQWVRTGWVALAAAAVTTAAASGQSCDGHSGYAVQTAWCARPSDTGAYVGYLVGGGSPYRGEGPSACEGVWGWDYECAHFWPRVALLWNHGRRYQGGFGAYRTDGPRILRAIKVKKRSDLIQGAAIVLPRCP